MSARSDGSLRFHPARTDKLLFCMEVANNHQGSVEHGKALLDALSGVARETGAEMMVKLQLRHLESFLHAADTAGYPGGPLSRHSARFRDTALRDVEVDELVQHARDLGLRPYATPFDEASVEQCLRLGFDLIKVASCSAYDWPLLQRVADTGLPVICSVGGMPLNEIDDVVDYFARRRSPLALMHCIAAYPTPVEHLQLDQIVRLRDRFPDVEVGYSGHEGVDDLFAVGLAVAKGATMLERHAGLPAGNTKLNAYSLPPDRVGAWIREAQRAAVACATGQPRHDAPGEKDSLMSLRRGIYARRTIPMGQTLAEDDVYLAMPCLDGQFHAGKLTEVVGSFTPMDPIYVNMPVGLSVVSPLPKALVLASIAGRVKEMLADARIELDPSPQMELSHQYGFDRFFEHGGIIIDIVNREYCKKLILQFPGQQHPAHKHIQKEETFQIISGSLNLLLNGEEKRLQAGETQLITRGAMHSFSTETGVIFEEISTTHIKGDSEYEDPAIPSDPSWRKTPLSLP